MGQVRLPNAITTEDCNHGEVDCAFEQKIGLLTKRSGSACTNTYTFFLPPVALTTPSLYNYFYWMTLSYQSYVPKQPPASSHSSIVYV